MVGAHLEPVRAELVDQRALADDEERCSRVETPEVERQYQRRVDDVVLCRRNAQPRELAGVVGACLEGLVGQERDGRPAARSAPIVASAPGMSASPR